MLFFPQAYEHLEYFPPVAVTGKIIVREKIKIQMVLMIIIPQRIDQHLWRADPHFFSLHVDDGAETAIEWATPAAINRSEIGNDEFFEVFLDEPWE